MADLNYKDTGIVFQTGLSDPAADVSRVITAIEKQVHLGQLHMRPIHMLEERMEDSKISGEGDPHPKVFPPSFEMVTPGKKRTPRLAITPPESSSANFIDMSKEGWDTHL